MPDTPFPGVFIEEVSTPPPIVGVSTSTAGFAGVAERGPEYACLVTSWAEYQRLYGGGNPSQSFLADAVYGFFANGGQRSYITRVVPGAARAASASLGGLVVQAIGRGSWGQNIFFKFEPSAAPVDGETRYKISIWYYRAPVPRGNPDPSAPDASPNRRKPEAFEQYDNLTGEQGAENYLLDVINSHSNLVRVAWDARRRPALPANPLTVRLRRAASGGSLQLADFVGDLDPIGGLAGAPLGSGRGLKALEAIDEIALLCVPDEVHPTLAALRTPLRAAILNQCETHRDRFAILSAEAGRSDIDHPPLLPPRDSAYAAFYYPWIEVLDPQLQKKRLVPPTGHLAGIYARTDLERGVHKAPANEVVREALNLELPVTQAIQDSLNPRNVNCLRDFRPDSRGIRVWGARTMSSDPEWRYVNIRRLFIFVENSIARGTQWVVFEPNDEPLWARVRQNVTNFLVDLWRSGLLLGATPDQAFFVRCDRSTMTQHDIDHGRLICLIGLAAVRPAEFVIFRIGQKTAGALE